MFVCFVRVGRPMRARCCSTDPKSTGHETDPMALTLGLLFIVVLLVLAVPFWVALGLGTIALLLGTGALPLSLLGEALFPGSRLVRADRDSIVRADRRRHGALGAREQAARFRRGDDGRHAIRLRHIDGARLRLLRLHLGLRRRRCRGHRTHHDGTAGRARLSQGLCLRAGSVGRVHRHSDSAVDRVHHRRARPRPVVVDTVHRRVLSRASSSC